MSKIRIIGKHYHQRKMYPTDRMPYLQEIDRVLQSIDVDECRTKQGKEQTRKGEMLISPIKLNSIIKKGLVPLGWAPKKVGYHNQRPISYIPAYQPVIERVSNKEVDFCKNIIGAEFQFGKYFSGMYDISTKLIVLYRRGEIKLGVCITPSHKMIKQMSTGVGTYEKLVRDLRDITGEIKMPLLILGIEPS